MIIHKKDKAYSIPLKIYQVKGFVCKSICLAFPKEAIRNTFREAIIGVLWVGHSSTEISIYFKKYHYASRLNVCMT